MQSDGDGLAVQQIEAAHRFDRVTESVAEVEFGAFTALKGIAGDDLGLDGGRGGNEAVDGGWVA